MTETTGTPAQYDTATDSLEQRLRDALAPNLQLVREIGAGGMARVFLAREPALRRLVAVKVLSGDLALTEAGRARFEREAQAVAGLSHPNVVAVHAVGELSDGTPYFIMQFVEGRSLSDRVEKEGPLPIAEARRILGEVAAALAAAHKQGIIHRDVKPANILYEDATGRALVSDFGIAAVGHDAAAAPVNVKLTATGSILGTPQYMSPEQLLAEPVTEKTDVYSVGLLAHEMLAGSAPFKGSSPHELIAAHLRDVPARLSARRPDVDPELEEVVARCLEKDAGKRPTADEVAKRLVPGAGALLEWPPPGLEELHGRLRAIARLFLIGGGTLALALLTLLVGGPKLDSARTSVVTLVLMLAGLAGAVALAAAEIRSLKASLLAARAVRAGYAWMTVLETLADVRGDTGNIIAGSREYAGLRADQRDFYRKMRVWREFALFAGGFLAVPVFLAVTILGSSGLLAPRFAWVALLPWIAGVAVASRLSLWEERAFAANRIRRSGAQADTTRLAPPWYESFETVRQGQRLGRGREGIPQAGRAATYLVTAALVVMFVVSLPLIAIGGLGPGYWTQTLPKFANTKGKVRVSNVARPYMLAKDTSITPATAGHAMALLHTVGRQGRHHQFPVRALDSLPKPVWYAPMPPGVFDSTSWHITPTMPSPMKIFAAWRSGFSAAERAYLQRLATEPHWTYWDQLARARSYDYLAARFQLPFREDASPWAMPILRFQTTKDFAYASMSRAAHHLAAGRRDSAEAIIRGTVSVGFLMIDQGNFLIEQLIGAVVAGIGRQGLTDYFKAIGDPRGAELQARLDAVVAQEEAMVRNENARDFSNAELKDSRAVRARVMRMATDPLEERGLRFSMVEMLSLSPCSNLRELVFGHDSDVRAALDSARASMSRFASDTALFDMLERHPENLVSLNLPVTPLDGLARLTGSMLRNRRLAGCWRLIEN